MATATPGDEGLALRPRARIMRTLGEELISSETVAILELVKNAYDADARTVLVKFSGSLQQGEGSLEVSDDGVGMTLLRVRTAWMEPATDAKKKARETQYLKRRVLGEKGVGRFATARLAEELELITRAPEDPHEVYALFDWNQFEKEDRYLDEVLILVEERTPQEIVRGRPLPGGGSARARGDLPRDGSHGTVLRMSRLKRTWGDRELRDLRRGLSRLVSPFGEERDFRIFLQLLDQDAGDAQEVEAPRIIKYPHYTIDGEVAADGRFTITIHLHSEGQKEVVKGWFRYPDLAGSEMIMVEKKAGLEGTREIECGSLSFRVLVWDRDQLGNIEQKLGIGFQTIRNDLNSIAGISVYRDGFRVLPYGEPNNDWLRLDIRRVQNPTMRLSNNQLTGYIKISADANPLLRDQSNREGLDRNDAYADLQSVMLLSLAQLERLRFQQRRKGGGKRGAHVHGLLDAPELSELHRQMSKLRPGDKALNLFDKTMKRWEQQILHVREVLSRYHTLATLGQLVDVVVHDSRQPLSTIQGQAALGLEYVNTALESPASAPLRTELRKVVERFTRVRAAADMINAVVQRIEPLGGRQKGKRKKLYLEDIIRASFAHFARDIEERGAKVTLPTSSTLVEVDEAEIQEVLINLLSNSLYWLAQVPKSRRAIVVQCSRPHPGEVEIVFADSGPGIASEIRESIFEPYFTTKPNGVGLGLAIAGEIVRDYYDGTLELLDSGPLRGSAFRIVLRNRE